MHSRSTNGQTSSGPPSLGKNDLGEQAIGNQQLPHWAYAVVALAILLIFLVLILNSGRSEPTKHKPLQTPSLTTSAYYPSPTSLPITDTTTASVSASSLRVFDDPVSGNCIAQLRNSERVSVVAQSTDGTWLKVVISGGEEGWSKADRLVMTTALHPTIPAVQIRVPPDILFEDDFENSDSGLANTADGTAEMRYEQGHFVMRVPYGSSAWALYPGSFTDFQIEVEAHSVTGGSQVYGLVFRRWEGNGYRFIVFSDGSYQLLKEIDNRQISLAHGYPPVPISEEAEATRLRIRAEASNISLYVNDQFLQTVTDTSFEGGQVGLAVEDFGYGGEASVAEVHFDNLEVRSLTHFATPTLSVSDRVCRLMVVVEPSDTVRSIAIRYGVSVWDMAAANDTRHWRDLGVVGKLLCIPPATFVTDDIVDPTPIPGSGCRFMHVVRSVSDLESGPGDDLYYVATRYGVFPGVIAEANGLNDWWYLEPGMILCIP